MNVKALFWPSNVAARIVTVSLYVIFLALLVFVGGYQVLYTVAGRPGQPVADFVREVNPANAGKVTFRENLYWNTDTNPLSRIMLEGPNADSKLVTAVEKAGAKCDKPLAKATQYEPKGLISCEKSVGNGKHLSIRIVPIEAGNYNTHQYYGFNGGPPENTEGGAALLVNLNRNEAPHYRTERDH